MATRARGMATPHHDSTFQSRYRSSIIASASLLRAPLGRPGSPLLPGKKRWPTLEWPTRNRPVFESLWPQGGVSLSLQSFSSTFFTFHENSLSRNLCRGSAFRGFERAI
jgi:hypothetical protein